MSIKIFNKIGISIVLTTLLVLSGKLSHSQLTIYSNTGQSGTSGTCLQSTIYTGAAIPASLDNQISSIQLQQGFLATLAENTDGTGAAYTFVAAISNVTVNLSNQLNKKVSFIRVLPIRNTLKKGAGLTNNTFIDSLNVTWFYDWGSIDASTASREYSIMTWGRNSANNTHPTNNTNNYIAKPNITHLLSFNEPDNTGQANMAVGESVTLHQNLARTGYRLGSPAPTEGQATVWLKDFMDSADRRNVKVDFIALHWYDWGSYLSTLNTAPNANDVFNRFKSYITTLYKLYNKPIWITEFNANVNTTIATNIAFMNLALPWLEQQPFVERYAFFFESGMPPLDASGKITPIGSAYQKHISTTAYPRNWDNTENIATTNNASYEAENATLMGTAVVQSCIKASNLAQVINISATGGNRLIFHDVKVLNSGTYTLGVVYFSTVARNITVQVNGNAPKVYAIPASSANFCTANGTSATYPITIALESGLNKIIFTESPNIDKININALVILPVNIVEFYPVKKTNGIELNWKTAQEIDNKYFDLFKSTDGVSFMPIARIMGNGTSSLAHNYTYLDLQPTVGTNYYRLQQVDINGATKQSKTVQVQYGTKYINMSLVSSTANNLTVQINAQEVRQGHLVLAGLDGKMLYQKTVALQTGSNQIVIPISWIKTGLALLSLRTNKGVQTIKLLL